MGVVVIHRQDLGTLLASASQMQKSHLPCNYGMMVTCSIAVCYLVAGLLQSWNWAENYWFQMHLPYLQVMLRHKDTFLSSSNSQSTSQFHPEFLAGFIQTKNLTEMTATIVF